MGVDLIVPYPKKLVLRTVLETARNLFASMLGLKDTPDFSVRKIEKGKYIKFEMDALLQSDGMYLVSLKGMETAAFVELLAMHNEYAPEYPYFEDEEEGIDDGVYVGMHGARSPVRLATAASLAVAIASQCETRIYDDSCWWVSRDVMPWREFLGRLTVNGQHGRLDDALEEFDRRLYKAGNV